MPFSAKQYLNIYLQRYLKQVKQKRANAQSKLLALQENKAIVCEKDKKEAKNIPNTNHQSLKKAEEKSNKDDTQDDNIIAYLQRQLAKRDNILCNLTKIIGRPAKV